MNRTSNRGIRVHRWANPGTRTRTRTWTWAWTRALCVALVHVLAVWTVGLRGIRLVGLRVQMRRIRLHMVVGVRHVHREVVVGVVLLLMRRRVMGRHLSLVGRLARWLTTHVAQTARYPTMPALVNHAHVHGVKVFVELLDFGHVDPAVRPQIAQHVQLVLQVDQVLLGRRDQFGKHVDG